MNPVGTKVKMTVFFTMVHHPIRGRFRAGNAYSSRAGARSWLPFVAGSWRGCRVSVAQCTIRWVDGNLTERSRQVLDQKFNLDPPEAPLVTA